MKYFKAKTNNYITLLILLSIIMVFIHSVIIHNCHVDDSHDQHDFCNLVSNIVRPRQDNIQKYGISFKTQPLIDNVIVIENIYQFSDISTHGPSLKIPVILLLETFLI